MTYGEIGQIVTGTTGILLLGLAGYTIGNLRYKVPGTSYFVALTVAGAIWCFGYFFEKSQTLAENFFLAAQIEYLGLAWIPPLWLLVTLSWMEHPLARSKAFRSVVLGFAAVLVAVVWTNDFHHLWYEGIVPTATPGFARFYHGTLYTPVVLVYLATFCFSSVELILRRKKTSLFRRKAAVIFTTNLFPVVFAAAFQLGFRPGGLDPTIFSTIPAFMVLAWGLFRHDFIRTVPIARDSVVESLDDAVLIFNTENLLVDYNKAAKPHLDLFLEALALFPAPFGEFSIPVGGQSRTYRFRRSVIEAPGNHNQGSVVVLSDTTDEKRRLEEMEHLASHDDLTGIANRRHFEFHALGEITRASRHGGTLALVLFDLDHFKEINDHFGHPTGDKVLRSVAEIVNTRLRPYDLLARVGGEEFAVLMPETNPVEAREAAERWRAAFEETPFPFPGTIRPVTASFGVATLNDLPVGSSTSTRFQLESLLSYADKALYRAKTGGRNRVC